mmetsp:Transcript_86089/g.240904  ORF Transcript_86089/g.240904 Transcript_86089/m.240904 type:complete len:352 (+) Transcript_86089:72-1127(+)
MSPIGLVFELQVANTLPGESVFILGNRVELGGWKMLPGPVVQLCTTADTYPRWTAPRIVWFECPEARPGDTDFTIEYKYVVSRIAAASNVGWEGIAENRQVVLPLEPGSLWLVTDAELGRLSAPIVSRTSTLEVRSRWASFTPEWLSLPLATRPSPDYFALTPRLPLDSLGRQKNAKVFDIESDFSALSPGRPCRDFVPRPESTVDSPRSSRSDTSQDDSESSGDAAVVVSTGMITLPAAEYAALITEIKALRDENQELQHTLVSLSATTSQCAEVLIQPRKKADTHMSHSLSGTNSFSQHSGSTSGTNTPSSLQTPAPKQQRQHGDIAYWMGPATFSTFGVSVQEPQEEP